MTTRLSSWCLALGALAACEAPPAPPGPPMEKLPPLESASTCSPGAKLVNREAKPPDKFYFADLETDKSCEVFLEEDECIIGIFDDCTWEAQGIDPMVPESSPARQRQWIGRLNDMGSHKGMLDLNPLYGTPPTMNRLTHCFGEVDEIGSSQASARLTCGNNHRGFYLEKRDMAAKPLFTTSLDDVTVLAATTDNSDQNMKSIVSVRSGTTSVFWTALSLESTQGGGVYKFRAGQRQATLVNRLSYASQLAAGPNYVLATVKTGNYEAKALALIDIATEQVVATGTVSGNITALAADPIDDTFLVAYNDAMAQGLARVQRLGRRGQRLQTQVEVTFETRVVQVVLPVASASGVEVVIAANDPSPSELRSASYLRGYNHALVERWRVSQDDATLKTLQIEGLTAITAHDRAAVIGYDARRYYEVDVTTGQLYSAVPNAIFAGMQTARYDAAHDRVILLSAWGNVTVLDRSSMRIAQPTLWIENDLGPGRTPYIADGVWDPASERMFVTDPQRASVIALRPRPADK